MTAVTEEQEAYQRYLLVVAHPDDAEFSSAGTIAKLTAEGKDVVIVQVTSFKLTGKRIFKMAPIHHHFEMLGWTESQVVIRFWIISIVLALVGLSSLKLR